MTTRDEAEFFDQRAARWDENPGRIALSRAVFESLHDAVPLGPEMRVLEYGCGTGLVGLRVAPHVCELTAVDTSAGMLDVLRRKLAAASIDNVRLVHAVDGELQRIPEAAFDLVFASMVLHHVEDVSACLTRFRRWLVPGGWLAIADLDAEDGSFHGDATATEHHGFERAQLVELVAGAGLTMAEITTAHVVRKPVSGGHEMRDFTVFMLAARRPDEEWTQPCMGT